MCVGPGSGLEVLEEKKNVLPTLGFKTRTVQPVGKSLYLPRCPGAKLRSILPENQMHRSLWHLSLTEIMILMQFLSMWILQT